MIMRASLRFLCAILGLGLIAWHSPLHAVRQSMASESEQLARRPLLPLSINGRAAAQVAVPVPSTVVAQLPSVVEQLATRISPPPPLLPMLRARLVHQPLPRCSVLFFHHVEKTGGTTLRSILQRHAQRGEFDLVSFVNRFDKLQLQMVIHRLHSLLEMPGGLDDLRLAVEIHIGAHITHPYFSMYTYPDLLLLRSLLRARGCRCNLVTLVRHPLLMHLSWHYVSRVPLPCLVNLCMRACA